MAYDSAAPLERRLNPIGIDEHESKRGRAIAFGRRGFIFLFVIPAEAGIQGCKSVLVALDPGFRRGDGR